MRDNLLISTVEIVSALYPLNAAALIVSQVLLMEVKCDSISSMFFIKRLIIVEYLDCLV